MNQKLNSSRLSTPLIDDRPVTAIPKPPPAIVLALFPTSEDQGLGGDMDIDMIGCHAG